jgi:HSP20 family molecular chaperone IbpA
LPKAASEEEVNAEMKDGVLTIRIKKVEEAKPRRIEIK